MNLPDAEALCRELAGKLRGGVSASTGLVGIRTDNVLQAAGNAAKPDAYIGYLLPFEIISVHLLVVLVGAAFLARAKRRVGAREQGLELSGEGLGSGAEG